MSSNKAVIDSEPVAFTNEEAKQILHQFAKEIGSFELDFYNFDELNYRHAQWHWSLEFKIPCENDKVRIEPA